MGMELLSFKAFFLAFLAALKKIKPNVVKEEFIH
jgi:hypothetical protein